MLTEIDEAMMESSMGWVELSNEHRNRVKTVLDLLSTPGMVDELGVGIIRDVFSDHLFPSISTILNHVIIQERRCRMKDGRKKGFALLTGV